MMMVGYMLVDLIYFCFSFVFYCFVLFDWYEGKLAYLGNVLP